jgi:hypothetical protein
MAIGHNWMKLLRQPALTQQILRQIRKPVGKDSNRDKELLETGVSYTIQMTAYPSNRDKMRFFTPQAALFQNSLPANGLVQSPLSQDARILEIRASHTKQITSIFLIDSFCALFAPRSALKEQFS